MERRGSRWLAGETAAGRHISLTGDPCLIGFHSDTGKKPALGGGTRRINQDTALVAMLGAHQGADLLFAVYDGHGDSGRKMSRVAARLVHDTLIQAADDPDKAAVLKKALPAADMALPAEHAKASGTTAIVAILQQKPSRRVIVACVGDSRCVLGRPSRSGFLGMGKEGPWEAVPLSVDQKPDEPEERKRIEAAGGTVTGGGSTGEPARVWRHIDGFGKVGVAIARSVGDHALAAYGVNAEPELVEQPLETSDAVIILGSDGLWDFVSNEKAVSIAQSHYPDADAAAAHLIKTATKRWRKAEVYAPAQSPCRCTCVYFDRLLAPLLRTITATISPRSWSTYEAPRGESSVRTRWWRTCSLCTVQWASARILRSSMTRRKAKWNLVRTGAGLAPTRTTMTRRHRRTTTTTTRMRRARSPLLRSGTSIGD